MQTFVFENPPVMDTPEGQRLAEYLSRQLSQLSSSLRTVYNWQDARPLPGRVFEGMVRFISTADPAWFSSPGLYVYLEDEWRLLVDSQFLIDNFVLAGYGGIYQGTPGIPGSSIGAAWQTLTNFDTASVTTPRFVTQDTANNGLILDLQGIWAVSLDLGFEHNSSNQGRITNVRLYNNDLGIGSPARVVATGRNAEATNFSTIILAEVPEAEIGDLWQIQIGNGDSYTSVEWDAQSFEVWHVSEYKTPASGDL